MTAENGGQYNVLGLADGFCEHDKAALARLTAAGRAAQLDIRQRLWRYTDEMWDQAKAATSNPAADPRYSAVVAMRDLMVELRAHAADAAHAAGDGDSG